MPRQTYGSLKPVKRQIAAGDLEHAIRALLGKHAALLMALSTNENIDDQTIIKCRLTIVETKLGVAYSLNGDYATADVWFSKAHKHFAAFDPVTHKRMDREEATHMLRKGQLYEALDLYTRTERGFRTLLRFGRSSLPEARVELEHAITLSCKADAELLLNPSNIEARETLEQVDTTLRTGNKPLYELDNLMRLIDHTSVFDPRRAGHIARATWINETVVHNPVIRLTLMDVCCGPLPLKSLIQRLGIARD